jgi:HSP20 family protein
MELIKWEPIREFEEMFNNYTKAMTWPSIRADALISGDWAPRVDISENDHEIEIRAEIPDVKKEDVKVGIDDGILTIEGCRNKEKEEKGKRFHRIERSYGSFARSFTLPDHTDGTKIKASFKDGMLNLHIPKTPNGKPKAIQVKVD